MEFGRCPYGGVEIDELVPGQLWVKIDGTWKQVIKAYQKVAGSWQRVTAWHKVSGAWIPVVM